MTPQGSDGRYPSPDKFGLEYQTLDLIAQDGVLIRAWFIKGDSDSPGIIMVHGKGGSKAGLLHLARVINQAGFHVMAVDLRGHGESGKAKTTFGLNEAMDVEVAVHALLNQKGVNQSRFGVYAQSMGTAAALLALGRNFKAKAFVLDSAWDSLDKQMEETAENIYGLPRFVSVPSMFFYKLLSSKWPSEVSPLEHAMISAAHFLIIHGDEDETVSIERGRSLFEGLTQKQSGEFKTFSAGHTGAWGSAPQEYERLMTDFFRMNLAEKSKKDTFAFEPGVE